MIFDSIKNTTEKLDYYGQEFGYAKPYQKVRSLIKDFLDDYCMSWYEHEEREYDNIIHRQKLFLTFRK